MLMFNNIKKKLYKVLNTEINNITDINVNLLL